MVMWPRIAGFLVVGYLCMTRSFAYVGMPPLFIGEIVLAAFVFLVPRVALGTWVDSLLRSSPLNALGLAMLVFMSYGVWQVSRGIIGGSSIFYTLKFFIFNYYALYLFLGIWVALQAPDTLPKLIRAVAWVNGIYGLMWIAVLRNIEGSFLGIPLFGNPGGSAVAILGLLCFERNLRAIWPLLALNIVVTLFMQVRAEWLGLGLGMLVLGFLTRRLGRVVAMGMDGLAVVGMIELAGIQLPGRTSTVSVGAILGRAIAPISLELAEEFTPDAKKHLGSAEWRELWWEQIWLSVHSTPMLTVFGHGYGFDLFGLAPKEVRDGQPSEVRTPHSVFYYALGYTGWVGVALFGILQFVILKLLLRAVRRGRQPAALVFWVMGISMAIFEESFDTPYRAIPFYLLIGMGIAPALYTKGGADARPARA